MARKQGSNAISYLHVYGQEQWHDDVKIVGNKRALRALRDAVNAVLQEHMDSYCYLTIRGSAVIVECSYSLGFVKDLKNLVPYEKRSWDPEQKRWTVDTSRLDLIKDLACWYYDRVWLLEGGITTDLKTGETVNPMFDPIFEAEV